MKKILTFTLIGTMILFGCTDNDVELPIETNGTSTIDVQIASVGFANTTTGRTSRTSSASNNITWNHIFGGTATITFTNTSTVIPIDSTYTIDMADFAVNGLSKTLINGDYDVVLTMTDNTPEDYVPVNATDSFTLSGNTSLVLDVTTTYGMALLDPYLVDSNVTPIFSDSGTDYNFSQDQGYYYLYIPGGVTGTVTLQESLFGQTVSKQITIASTTIDALELVPVTSNAGISLVLEEFIVEYDEWDIDAPVNGITPSFGLFTDSGQTLGSADAHDTILGDLDGDGDSDVLIINRVQNGQVWINDGSGNFSSGQNIATNDSVGAFLEDVDGDGDLDAFVVNNSNQPNEVWLNDGNGSFTNSGQSLGASSSTDVFLGDFDNDGDADAFVTNSDNASNTVWVNDGAGVFSQSSQVFPIAQSSIVSMGDFDGDGDLDAMLGSSIQVNQVWFNNGNGIFTDSGQTIWNTNAGTQEIATGDLDNDGDLDVYIVSGSNNPNSVWFNDGSGVFTDGGQFIYSNQATGIKLNDLDGDGDLDAFVVYFDRPNQVWLNDGSGTFLDNGQLLGNSYSDSVDLGDLDGDGDIDAFVGERSQPNKVWINN